MALILNLSLRSKGKDDFEEIKQEIFQVLGELVDHSDCEVRFYVRCVLYSLLNRESFKKEAMVQGVKNKLEILQEKGEQEDRQR